MAIKTCRLCLSVSTSNDDYFNIFSDFGIETKMCDIISEHFKCEINELDSLPNYVCHVCWSTTDAFHELYQKSKLIVEKFLNPLVKEELDFLEVCPSNKDNFIDEQVEVDPVKIEPQSDDELDANNLSPQFDLNDESDENGQEEYKTEKSAKQIDNTGTTSIKTIDDEKPRRKRKQSDLTKQKDIQFERLFLENRHLFDMSCDSCKKTFNEWNEARKHYANEHNNPKGYIKCCGIKLFYRCQVVQHLHRHLNPEKLKCTHTECVKVFSGQRELDRHMALHTRNSNRKEKTIPCSVCKKLFASNVSLMRHMRRHEENNETENDQHDKFIAENFDMKCDFCDVKFVALHDARHHYRENHGEEKGYLKCCSVKLRELWVIRDHIKSHLDPVAFKCDICGKSFSTGMILVQHKRRHRLTMHKSFICDYCNKAFRDKDAITRHMFTNHVNSEPKYECEICFKKFQLPILLKNHRYAVHREKKHSVTCEICGKSFYVKFHLDKHMLSHTDKSERLAQRKQCEHCGEWLLTKSGIYYHEQIHTSGVQKCSQCQMELPNKLALLGHIRQYHRERKFKCGYCDKTFATKSTMRTHEESHTRHNTYQCKFCPRTFTVPSSRRTHTRRNHQEELKQMKEMKNQF